MKKIINGKMYNTETATVKGEYSNSYSVSDFKYFEETLYQKKTGEFFLYGEGGPLSPYKEVLGDSGATGGEKILPLSLDEAKKWAEENLTADEYIGIFGEVEEWKLIL